TPHQRPGRHFRRHRGGGGARDLRWCRLGYRGCVSHAIPAYRLVRTVAVTESPAFNFLASSVASSANFAGMRRTTLAELPVALSGGNRANCEPLAGAISSTFPRITCPGYWSTRISAASPTLTFVSCVSL